MQRGNRKKKNVTLPTFKYEKEYFRVGIVVAGIDEAGRGAVAGPVVAAAVILNPDFVNDVGINDSKQLSAKKREDFVSIIQGNAISVGIGIIDNEIIDRINILQATQEAMHLAIGELEPQPAQLLIDGNYFRDNGISYKTIVRGDAKSLSIAAASIIAKVTRDRWMVENADKQFPEYGMAKHKGYGTKAHMEAIKEYGLCPLHRKTFLKKYLDKEMGLF
ncbi:ribonuclease HII [Bacteroidota bacterium]